MAGYIRAKDRVGTTIHNMKILDWKIENHVTYFYIHCNICGRELWKRSGNILYSKGYVGCGCGRHKIKDMTGQRFGRLTAIEPYKRENKNTMWKCKCDCGNICYVSQNALSNGTTKSCGCQKLDSSKKSGKERSEETLKYVIDGTNVRNLTANIRSDNKSGIKGVSWDKQANKWVAQIRFKGKNYKLGRFTKKEDAGKARAEAEKAIFRNYLEWFKEKYPERWKKMKH